MTGYSTTFTVDQNPQEVFTAVTNVAGWWSEGVEGVTDQLGGEFVHRYQNVHRCHLRITELEPGHKVAWHVLDNYFNFITDQGEWRDTDIVFEITPTEDGTQVHFTHIGLVPTDECYDVCVNAWAGYINGSLRNLITTGQGQPNPREDGEAPSHQDAATVQRIKRAPQSVSVATAD